MGGARSLEWSNCQAHSSVAAPVWWKRLQSNVLERNRAPQFTNSTSSSARRVIACFEILKKTGSISIPTLSYPTATAAAIVEPPPMKGSSTTPVPSGSEARTICRMNACGLREGCGAIARSSGRVGAERMTSSNGLSCDTRRSPPVFHLRRLSWTRPSQGFRKTPQGSQQAQGITVTSPNSA